MTIVQNRNTEERNGANAALIYSSVLDGVPIIGFRPAMIDQIDEFHDQVERTLFEDYNYQIMPKASLLSRYAITIMLWQPMKYVTLELVPAQLVERNPGLKGGLRVQKCKTFKASDTDKIGGNMEGVRLI